MLIARMAWLLQAVPGAPPSVTALAVRDGTATLDAVLASTDQRAAMQRLVDRLPGAALGAHPDAAAPPLAVRVTLRAGA